MIQLDRLLPNVSLRILVTLRSGRTTRTLALNDARWRTSTETTSTTWMQASAETAGFELWMRRPDRGRVEITAAVTGRSPWVVAECVFQVRVRAAASASVAWPFAAGAVVPVARLATGRTLELTYPVYASMQWVDVFDAGRGLYAATHDAEPYFKHMRLRSEGEGRRREILVEFAYTDLEWPADKQWTSPPLVLATHDGDWRTGAKIYRAWADTWFHHDPVPTWLWRECGHNLIAFPSTRERRPFSELPAVAAATRRLGIYGVHVADYMEEGFDTFYPAFRPDPKLGGERGLRRAIERMAAEGTWTSLYTNGRILDVAGPHGSHAFEWAVKLPPHVRERFDAMWTCTQAPELGGWDPRGVGAQERAPFNRDGSAAQEWWGRVFAAVCPTVPAWRELWLSRLSELVDTLGPHMFQVDQVCGCWGLPCYDAAHPHASPALAWSGYKAFAAGMRARLRERSDSIALWTEGVNDILGQSFDGLQAQLGFDSLLAGIGEWEPRLFRCTFPEFVLLSGNMNGTDRWAMIWALLLGGHCHFHMPEPWTLDATTRRWVRFVATVRRRHWREFASPDVSAPDVDGDAGVRAMVYRAGRRTLVIGAPMAPRGEPDRAFAATIAVDAPGRVGRVDSLGPASMRVRLRSGRLDVRGAGPFAVRIG